MVHSAISWVCSSARKVTSRLMFGATMSAAVARYGSRNFAGSDGATVFATPDCAVLHSRIARYPSGPSGASSVPSGLPPPPMCVVMKPMSVNASQTAFSKAAGSSPVAVDRKSSDIVASVAGEMFRGRGGSATSGQSSTGWLTWNALVIGSSTISGRWPRATMRVM